MSRELTRGAHSHGLCKLGCSRNKCLAIASGHVLTYISLQRVTTASVGAPRLTKVQAGLRQPAADGSGHRLAENSRDVSDVAASAAPASCQGVRGSPPKELALWQIAAAASPVDCGWSHGAEHRLCATGPLPTSRQARGQRERTRVALLIRNSIAAHHCRGANQACTRDARA